MAVRDFSVAKDNVSRADVEGAEKGSGQDQHLLAGKAGRYKFRSYIEFDLDWDNVGEIVSATVRLETTDDHIPNGAGPDGQLQMHRVTKEWAEGSAPEGENDWTQADFISPSVATGQRWLSEVIPQLPGSEVEIQCIDLVMKWAPPRVRKFGTDIAGKGIANHGVRIMSTNMDNADAQVEFASSEHPTAGKRPKLTIDYIPKRTQPTHTRINPNGAEATDNIDFVVAFSDADADDRLTAVDIRLRVEGSSTTWQKQRDVTAAEQAAGTATVNVSEVLPPGRTLKAEEVEHYEWKARVRDSQGEWSDLDASWLEFWVTNAAPSVTPVTVEMGSFATLDNVRFEMDYSDPDGDLIVGWQAQVRSRLSADDPGWGAGTTGLYWDSGFQTPTATEVATSRISRAFGGESLEAGHYTLRLRVLDNKGAWSQYALTNFTLTADYEVEPGSIDFLSGYLRKAPQWRIVLYDMDEDRGPGDIAAVIMDAANVGASTMTNDTGEFYFTLPSTHPQIGECEPFQRHYSFQQYRGGRWVRLFEGILIDFDATEDDTVFYGLDYLGLLSLSVDVRHAPNEHPDKPIEKGGAKYVDKTIRYVIKDQLEAARDENNGHVGFINVNDSELDQVAERITIFSSYKERLSFIGGLMDSVKQGTGRRTRLWVVRQANGNYRWRFRRNAGTTRDNLKLQYGSLVQGYRILAFGEFATKVHGIGRITNEVKPRFFTDGGDVGEGTFGRTRRAIVYNDLADKNDLKRRIRQAAAELSKVGKRVALGLRVVGLEPFEGWDLMDVVPVDIVHGVVNTNSYGSGYWVIWGTEYRVYPDGHDELTLVLRPKEDEQAPDEDLIDSDPPTGSDDWTSGCGEPDVVQEGDWYYDRCSGETWRKDDDGNWEKVTGDVNLNILPWDSFNNRVIAPDVVPRSHGIISGIPDGADWTKRGTWEPYSYPTVNLLTTEIGTDGILSFLTDDGNAGIGLEYISEGADEDTEENKLAGSPWIRARWNRLTTLGFTPVGESVGSDLGISINARYQGQATDSLAWSFTDISPGLTFMMVEQVGPGNAGPGSCGGPNALFSGWTHREGWFEVTLPAPPDGASALRVNVGDLFGSNLGLGATESWGVRYSETQPVGERGGLLLGTFTHPTSPAFDIPVASLPASGGTVWIGVSPEWFADRGGTVCGTVDPSQTGGGDSGRSQYMPITVDLRWVMGLGDQYYSHDTWVGDGRRLQTFMSLGGDREQGLHLVGEDGEVSYPMILEPSVWYRLREQRDGSAARARLWPLLEQEPEEWHVEVEGTPTENLDDEDEVQQSYFHMDVFIGQGTGVTSTWVVDTIDYQAMPNPGQMVIGYFVGYGDGETTVFSLGYPIVGNTLKVYVDGDVVEPIAIDATAGTFTFDHPPSLNAMIWADFKIGGTE